MFDLNLRPPYDKEEMMTWVKKSAEEAYMVKMNEEELELVSGWILTSKYKNAIGQGLSFTLPTDRGTMVFKDSTPIQDRRANRNGSVRTGN